MNAIDKIVYGVLCLVPAMAFLMFVVPMWVTRRKSIVIDESWTNSGPEDDRVSDATHIETLNWRE